MTMSNVILQSVITCPQCGFSQAETMPVDACVFFYDCPNCAALLRPLPGDCCVFCSYGSVKCPPIQAHALDVRSDGNASSPACCSRPSHEQE